MKFPAGRLLQFAKAPLPGRVKTRLAAEVGDAAAVQLHCRLVRYTFSLLHKSAMAPLQLWVSGHAEHPLFIGLQRTHSTPLYEQRGADLGERMHHALATALCDGDYAVLVGSDCPALDREYLDAAFAALDAGSDVVVGPARDGGYVLIGLRRPCSQLFQGMQWGADTVLAETRERLAMLDCDWLELPELWDVDRKADLAMLAEIDLDAVL